MRSSAFTVDGMPVELAGTIQSLLAINMGLRQLRQEANSKEEKVQSILTGGSFGKVALMQSMLRWIQCRTVFANGL